MEVPEKLRLGVEVGILLFVVALVGGQALGQPVLLGYVETGSMAPTMNPGDGFVAIPTALAGPIAEGDVVTFRAEELHGGGLTTHRVVGETERGFVTKGDANPFTDQDGDEPHVKRPQVVAKAATVGGSVVVIPHLGTFATGVQSAFAAVQQFLAASFGSRALLGTQGLVYIVLAASVLGYVADLWLASDSTRLRERSRDREDGWGAGIIVVFLALVVVVPATASMTVPGGTQEFGIVSAETDAPGLRVIETGTSESATYSVHNGGFVPMHVVVEGQTDGAAVTPRWLSVPARTTANATMTLSAPPETGYYREYVVERRYFAVVPAETIRGLYGVHPWLPLLAVDLVLASPFLLVGRLVLGRGRVRLRSRDDDRTDST
jgi:signal peptidase